MTMYHRGRVKSPYRKHAFAAPLGIPSSGATVNVHLRTGPADGLLLIKSVRCAVLIPAVGANKYVAGWMGYGRSSAGDPSPNFAINQSEVFGVQEFVIGPSNDQVLSLPLKGITLNVGEAWYLVGARTSGSSGTTAVTVASFLYAIQGTDAT